MDSMYLIIIISCAATFAIVAALYFIIYNQHRLCQQQNKTKPTVCIHCNKSISINANQLTFQCPVCFSPGSTLDIEPLHLSSPKLSQIKGNNNTNNSNVVCETLSDTQAALIIDELNSIDPVIRINEIHNKFTIAESDHHQDVTMDNKYKHLFINTSDGCNDSDICIDEEFTFDSKFYNATTTNQAADINAKFSKLQASFGSKSSSFASKDPELLVV